MAEHESTETDETIGELEAVLIDSESEKWSAYRYRHDLEDEQFRLAHEHNLAVQVIDFVKTFAPTLDHRISPDMGSSTLNPGDDEPEVMGAVRTAAIKGLAMIGRLADSLYLPEADEDDD